TVNAARHSARPGNASVAANPPATTTTTTGKKGGGGKDKGAAEDKTSSKQQPQLATSLSTADLQEEQISDWLTRELSPNETEAILNIQKSARGYLQR
ncbi:unnamed protein product, partial [Rotaria socialis]